ADEQPRFAAEFGILSGSSSHADRVTTIRAVHSESDVIIDPHTADGVTVARENLEPGVPMLVLETAKPAKFPEIVTEATGRAAPLPDHLRGLLELPQHQVEMANDEASLRAYISEHALR